MVSEYLISAIMTNDKKVEDAYNFYEVAHEHLKTGFTKDPFNPPTWQVTEYPCWIQKYTDHRSLSQLIDGTTSQ